MTDISNIRKTEPRTLTKDSPTNGKLNKLQIEDRRVHDWYRFVLSYPPHLVADYIERFHLTGEQTILDPFCGTGTTLVESKLQGIQSIGLEAHAFSHFVSSVKINWDIDADALHKHAQHVAERVRKILRDQGIDDDSFFSSIDENHFALKKLSLEKEKLLLTKSISPLPLHKSLVLLEELQRDKNTPFHRHELIAFAHALVHSISNLKFGPEVGIGTIRNDAPVIESWFRAVKKIVVDIKSLNEKKRVSSAALYGDARSISDILPPESIDAVITSPPYPNEKDYTRTTRLESVLLGFINSKPELRDGIH